jgi:glyoxylase-like metal-dependent hydrolase (beta-lactamase superfamily II)
MPLPMIVPTTIAMAWLPPSTRGRSAAEEEVDDGAGWLMNEPRLARRAICDEKKSASHFGSPALEGIIQRRYTRPQSPMKTFAAILLSLLSLTSAALAQSTQPEWCRTLPNPKYKTLQRVTVPDSWFEVYEVSHAVFAIYEPRQSEGTISYLIVGNQRAVLFDTGMGIGDLKKVTSELTKLPIIVLNSHTHNDHVGSNWQFSIIYSMDTSFTRQNAKGSSVDAQAEIKPSEICGDLPTGFDPRTYATKPWKITKYIHDGNKIDLGGRSLQVISTPGHTPDAICLFDQANGLLFTGDTFYPGTIWLYRPETDLQAYDTSIHRLAALVPQLRSVHGAHDFPYAPPSVLPELVADFEAVRAGKVPAVAAGAGKARYKGKNVSFLMKSQE